MSNVTSVTNHFSTANEGFITTAGGTVAPGAVVVPLTSTSGLTNGTVFVGIIEPGAINQQVFTGTVDTTGSQITGVVWTRGVNVTHVAGVTIVDYVSGTGHNMMTKGILTSLDQDGTLKSGSVDNSAVLAQDVVTTAKVADGAVTFAKTSGIWWEELGRVTLSTAGDTLSVASLPNKKYLQFRFSLSSTGGNTNPRVIFNNDAGANYAERLSSNGAADGAAGPVNNFGLTASNLTGDRYGYCDVFNISTKEKTAIWSVSEVGTAGAGFAATRLQGVAKWANTSSVINRIDIINISTGDFAIGSELIILGHN